jgi:hypothetical protein
MPSKIVDQFDTDQQVEQQIDEGHPVHLAPVDAIVEREKVDGKKESCGDGSGDETQSPVWVL